MSIANTPSPGATQASLPVTIRAGASRSELAELVAHRSAAYARELPEMGRRLSEPEPADERRPGREIFCARSKLDGGIIGSVRVHLNNEDPIPLESCVELGPPFAGARLLEACRLSITGGLVCRQALFKAVILYAQQSNVDYAVVAARPRISVIHESIGFVDLTPGRLHPLSYAAGIEHRALWLPLRPEETAAVFMARKKSLHDFFFATDHGKDIDVSGALPV